MDGRKVTKWNMIIVMAWFLFPCFHSFYDHHEGWDEMAKGYFNLDWRNVDVLIFYSLLSVLGFISCPIAIGTVHLDAWE